GLLRSISALMACASAGPIRMGMKPDSSMSVMTTTGIRVFWSKPTTLTFILTTAVLTPPSALVLLYQTTRHYSTGLLTVSERRVKAAPTNPVNSGWGRLGRERHSGWNWLATNHG